MKACKVTFSAQLLFEQIGLVGAHDLMAYTATADVGTVTLYLTGEHPDLPEVKSGEGIPTARIVCKRIGSQIESRLEIQKNH